LWLLDQPVPSNMDGRVLTDLFIRDQPVTYREVDEAEAEDDDMTLSAADEAAITETLRGLGYLD
jgi:hypothetical protein